MSNIDYNNRLLAFLISLSEKIDDSSINLNISRFYFNGDLKVATEAIRASGVEGNVNAVEELFHVIEEGIPELRIEAVNALSEINAPLIYERLIEYFNLLSNKDVKIEILKLLNGKYYKNKEVNSFNRGIITDSTYQMDYKVISISGLVKSKDFSFISYLFPHGEKRLLEEILKQVIQQDGFEIEEFLKKQLNNLNYFSDRVLGYYLCAYTLKVGGAKTSILNRILSENDSGAVTAYLDLCENGIFFTNFSKRLFRILLSFPVLDYSTNYIEGRVYKLLKIIIGQANKGNINDIKEFSLTCNVQLTHLSKDLITSHVSLSGIKTKQEFYQRFFAQLFETQLPKELLEEVIEYFSREKIENSALIISMLMQFVKSSEDKRRIEASVPLFYEKDERKRKQMYTILKKVNPEIKFIIRKIVRVLYSVKCFGAKKITKRVNELYKYSISEKFYEVEAASITALSALRSEIVRDRIKDILIKSKGENYLLVSSAIKSISTLTITDMGKIITNDFISNLKNSNLVAQLLDSISELKVKIPNKLVETIVNSMDIFKNYDLLDKVEIILSEKSDWLIYPSLKFNIENSSIDIKKVCIEILKGFKRRGINIKSELIVNLLYSILEKKSIENKEELYSTIISFLMELNDDYSFKIFKSMVKEGNARLVLKIIEKLPFHVSRKVFFDIIKLIEILEPNDMETLENYFKPFPKELIDESMSTYIINTLRAFFERGRTLSVSEVKINDRDNISLIERPKVEFKIQHEQTREVTVFFIDIANYTSLSARLNLTGLMKIVNNFESIVISTIENLNGKVIKKMGDGVLAIFNHSLNSVVASLIIQDRIRDFNDFASANEKFKARIGVHFGPVVFRNNDIFGDTVNIASRIESVSEPERVLVSEKVYNLTKEFVGYVERGPLSLKGVSEAVKSYIPVELSKDLVKYLEIKHSNKNAILSDKMSGEIGRKLRVIMYNPDFTAPEGINKKFNLKEIKSIFESLSRYVENFAKDYLEEYEIKAWFQNKWNEILEGKNRKI